MTESRIRRKTQNCWHLFGYRHSASNVTDTVPLRLEPLMINHDVLKQKQTR
jgi:hypothetical protein